MLHCIFPPCGDIKGPGARVKGQLLTAPLQHLARHSWTLKEDPLYYFRPTQAAETQGVERFPWMDDVAVMFLPSEPPLTSSASHPSIIPNYSIMHHGMGGGGHRGRVHSKVNYHLQPYNSRLLGLYIGCIFTNATYDVSYESTQMWIYALCVLMIWGFCTGARSEHMRTLWC